MRRFTYIAVLLVLFGRGSNIALADGGQVRVMERQGDVVITVFTSPTPLRAGPADICVLVQDAGTNQVLPEAAISVELIPVDGSHEGIMAVATTEDATNKLFRAASVEIPSAGRWNVRVDYSTGDRSAMVAAFEMEVAPPLPPWLAIWPWFTWPIAVVLLFIIHRWRVARIAQRRAARDALSRPTQHVRAPCPA